MLIARFMVTMIAHTATLVFRPVIRSSVMPKDVLLQTAARMASDPEQLLSSEMVTRFSRGSMSVTWWPRPKNRMLIAVIVGFFKFAITDFFGELTRGKADVLLVKPISLMVQSAPPPTSNTHQ